MAKGEREKRREVTIREIHLGRGIGPDVHLYA